MHGTCLKMVLCYQYSGIHSITKWRKQTWTIEKICTKSLMNRLNWRNERERTERNYKVWIRVIFLTNTFLKAVEEELGWTDAPEHLTNHCVPGDKRKVCFTCTKRSCCILAYVYKNFMCDLSDLCLLKHVLSQGMMYKTNLTWYIFWKRG